MGILGIVEAKMTGTCPSKSSKPSAPLLHTFPSGFSSRYVFPTSSPHTSGPLSSAITSTIPGLRKDTIQEYTPSTGSSVGCHPATNMPAIVVHASHPLYLMANFNHGKLQLGNLQRHGILPFGTSIHGVDVDNFFQSSKYLRTQFVNVCMTKGLGLALVDHADHCLGFLDQRP